MGLIRLFPYHLDPNLLRKNTCFFLCASIRNPQLGVLNKISRSPSRSISFLLSCNLPATSQQFAAQICTSWAALASWFSESFSVLRKDWTQSIAGGQEFSSSCLLEYLRIEAIQRLELLVLSCHGAVPKVFLQEAARWAAPHHGQHIW